MEDLTPEEQQMIADKLEQYRESARMHGVCGMCHEPGKAGELCEHCPCAYPIEAGTVRPRC